MGADTSSCFPLPYPGEVIKSNAKKQGVKKYLKYNFIIIRSSFFERLEVNSYYHSRLNWIWTGILSKSD